MTDKLADVSPVFARLFECGHPALRFADRPIEPCPICEVARLRAEVLRLSVIEVAAAELGAALRTGEQCHTAGEFVEHITPALGSVRKALVNDNRCTSESCVLWRDHRGAHRS